MKTTQAMTIGTFAATAGRRALALAAVLALATTAQAADDAEAMGKVGFADYCGACHGADAKGGGPFANLLNKAPGDLTMLAKSNDGQFPFNRVYDVIDGRDMPGAHGNREMPIWGGQWKQKGTLGAETALRGRILEIILYLRSIQQ